MTRSTKHLDTVVIGAGQAGLSTSYYLTQRGREHVILEKERIGKAWRDERWDSFTLVTPNWQLQLPGHEYNGDKPDGFLTRQEMVDYLLGFADSFDPPVQEGVEATVIQEAPDSDRLIVRSSVGDLQADNVVVATGSFQRPRIPPWSKQLSRDIEQIHSRDYRNPDQLPDGPILVVGSGQSGCQIADELSEAGRRVYLATSRVRRLPRRYRGADTMLWLNRMRFFDRTVDQLPSPAARFVPVPQVSGKGGGRDINLHQFCRNGIILLGHMRGAQGTWTSFEPDLYENLEAGDSFAQEVKHGIDKFIEEQGLAVPREDRPELQAGYDAPLITDLDLGSTGIRTVLWATGYHSDFSWVDLPIRDEYQYPVQQRGVTVRPGLYFVGLQWLHTQKSGLLFGVGDDAAHIVEHIELRN